MSGKLNSSIVDERVSTLFQPDSLLSDQFLETHRRSTLLEPEKRLMLAMLEDAITCYQKYVSAQKTKEKAIFAEVEEWFWEKGSNWFFSFENVAESLGLDPDYIRRGLTEWRERQARPKAKIYHLNSNQEPNTPGTGPSKVLPYSSRKLKSGTR